MNEVLFGLFLILILGGGFGLLLCAGVGIVNLTCKAADIYSQYRHRKELKESPEKAALNFKQYNIELKKETNDDREKNIKSLGFRQL